MLVYATIILIPEYKLVVLFEEGVFYFFMGLYLEVPINTIPKIPKGIGHIQNSASPMNINITDIPTTMIPVQNINILGFRVFCFIFIFLAEYIKRI